MDSHDDAKIVGLKSMINSASALVLIALRTHVLRERQFEVPEELKGNIDLRNEHDAWMEGLEFANELSSASGHTVNDPPLKQAAKLLAVRNDLIDTLKPLIRNQYDTPQTFNAMAQSMMERDEMRSASGTSAAIEQAKAQGRNAAAMQEQEQRSLARIKERSKEIMIEVLSILKTLEPEEGITIESDIGIVNHARMWSAALNGVGRQSDRAFLNGNNPAYGDKFRKDQLGLSELLTREGVLLFQAYQRWQDKNAQAISDAADKGVRWPELTQDWKKMAAGLRPAMDSSTVH
jgi:hypothetical protein